MYHMYDIQPFLQDAARFSHIKECIEKDRDTFHNMAILANTYEAYAPFCFFIKIFGKWCMKEHIKLCKRLELIERMCKIYKALSDIVQKPELSIEERCLIRTTVEILTENLKLNQASMIL